MLFTSEIPRISMYGYRGSDSIALRAASESSSRTTSQASERSTDRYAA